MTWAKRTDRDHKLFIGRLRELGWLVHDTSRLPGFVDAVAYGYFAPYGQLRLLEFKTGKGKHTTGQQQLLDAGWPIVTIRTVEDCEALR